MLQTLKEFYDDFQSLPNALKGVIFTVILFLFGFSVFFGVRNAIGNRRIEQLEKQNFELNRQAGAAEEKAARAETAAANEALRADSLESQLKALERRAAQTDEKINLQSQKSADLRDALRRVRLSRPANAGTDELERRLRARYGQTVGDQ